MIHLLIKNITPEEYAGLWAAAIVVAAIFILCFVKPEVRYMDDKGKFHKGKPPVPHPNPSPEREGQERSKNIL